MRTSPSSHSLRCPGGSAPTAAASECPLGPGHYPTHPGQGARPPAAKARAPRRDDHDFMVRVWDFLFL